MIFQNVKNLQNNDDKRYFKEKIDIYIKIVDALCKNSSIQLCRVEEKDYFEKMREMGIIDNIDQLDYLKQVLSKNRFNEFICAVSAEVIYPDLISPHVQNLNNTYRKKAQEEEKNRNAFTLVDLFCGAGGLSLGFKQCGFKTIFANDFERLCIETYTYNHPEIPTDRVVCGDIRKIAECISTYIPEEVDIVIGGPPCQGFSSANKHHRVIDDPRNELYKYFIII